jgi:hypothetical protein
VAHRAELVGRQSPGTWSCPSRRAAWRAPVDAAFPSRHTLVFRSFGDDATFRPLPQPSDAGYTPGGVLCLEEMAALKAGDPFRSPVFRQLV